MSKTKIIDGAMGTYVNSLIKNKGRVDLLNITNRELIKKIHKEYIEAGAEIITTNTFITNYLWEEEGVNPEVIINEGIKISREAINEVGKNIKVALDITEGQDGKNHFNEFVSSGIKYKINYFMLETMISLVGAKMWIEEIKDKCNIPIICSFTFHEKNMLQDGNGVIEICNEMEMLKVNYVGVNCSRGPEHCFNIANKMRAYTNIPIIIKPNLGLPSNQGKYKISLNEFREWGEKCKEFGVEIIGGCCGSTPEYIKFLK